MIPTSARTLVVAALAAALASPAWAIDCRAARTVVDRTICSSPSLLRADEALSRTYLELLRGAPDAFSHDVLQQSQRRWAEARSVAVAPSEAKAGGVEPLASALARVTGERSEAIRHVYAKVAADRRLASGLTGGTYAGYRTTCGFSPYEYGTLSYDCVGQVRWQDGDRVCVRDADWASFHVLSHRILARVDGRGLRVVATCGDGAPDGTPACPTPTGRPGSIWSASSAEGAGSRLDVVGPSRFPALDRYDPDGFDLEADKDWVIPCLGEGAPSTAPSAHRTPG